ncbi:sensor histidine kinase [Hamadaea tsunoensis]|uniref:sensor histidine kinase n=1 Tax=Hamadaea tsunoensis TaxID=53368 RepID=UPI0003FC56E4|nr:HAMP domain-containing sensor histidine kinase [Hamadaea tsunoensis]
MSFLRRHWTLRVRLTVVFGLLFFLAGAVVLAVTYFLMHRTLGQAPYNISLDFLPDNVIAKSVLADKYNKIVESIQAYRALTLKSLLQQGGVALLAVGVVAIGIAWILTGRVLRPIAQITATARRVADRNLHERINATGAHDEVRELADTLDSMLDRLDRAFDGQRRFVGNASHELKTPLAINRTLIEVAMGRPDAPPELLQLGQTLLEVNARHERLIDGLLMLARAENRLTGVEPVDLVSICSHLLEGVPGALRELAPAVVAGDPILLERLALNLIQNATRYNVPGGSVRVRCATAGAGCVLTVENTGPVVGAYEIPALFEPFRRLGADRVGSAKGTGLGLSIVRSIARAHDGDVTATPRPGGGLVVTVTLPAFSPSTPNQRPALTSAL